MAAPRKSFQPVMLDASMRIVALIGDDAYLVAYHSHKLADLLREKFGDLQKFLFDGSSAALAEVLDELRSLSLLQSHKFVIVDNADVFLKSSSDDDGAQPDDASRSPAPNKRAALERYAASPAPDATLLLRASTWRPGNLDKLISEVGSIIKLQPPNDDAAALWCSQRAAKHYRIMLGPQVAQQLVRLIGPDLAMLDSELGKLSCFAASQNRPSILPEDVDQMVGLSREDQAWAIQSAILSGSPAVALRKLHELLNISRVDWVPISWSIMDLLRKIHAASHLLAQGQNTGSIIRDLKLFGEAVQPILDLARRLSPQSSAQLLRLAVTTDQHNKSGIGEQLRNLESLAHQVADTIGHTR